MSSSFYILAKKNYVIIVYLCFLFSNSQTEGFLMSSSITNVVDPQVVKHSFNVSLGSIAAGMFIGGTVAAIKAASVFITAPIGFATCTIGLAGRVLYVEVTRGENEKEKTEGAVNATVGAVVGATIFTFSAALVSWPAALTLSAVSVIYGVLESKQLQNKEI